MKKKKQNNPIAEQPTIKAEETAVINEYFDKYYKVYKNDYISQYYKAYKDLKAKQAGEDNK